MSLCLCLCVCVFYPPAPLSEAHELGASWHTAQTRGGGGGGAVRGNVPSSVNTRESKTSGVDSQDLWALIQISLDT